MKITVAIVTRDRSKQLSRCLASLTKQTRKPNKVLVVDNGSTDATKESTLFFRNKLPIHYIFEGVIGIPYARNRVLENVRSGILAFLDDDCEAFPNWIEKILAAHKRFARVTAIQGWSISLPKNSYISILKQFNLAMGFYINSLNSHAFRKSLSLLETSKLLVIDAKNSSFKATPIRKLGIRFNVLFKRAGDTNFAKQLLACKQEIVFYPDTRVYHWEEQTVNTFLLKRFRSGLSGAKIYHIWPKVYFPKRMQFWWARRVFSFVNYCLKNGYGNKLPQLLSLFFAEKIIFWLGYSYELVEMALKGLHIRQAGTKIRE